MSTASLPFLSMPLHTIGKLLDASPQLKTVTARTRRLLELEKLYLASAPRELAIASRVKGYRAGTLFVIADNAAVAAKLKQLAPRLLGSIRKSEAEVTAIRIEVQVRGAQQAGERTGKKGLPADALGRFQDLARQLPEGALKSALSNLVRRHARPKKL